MEEERPIFLPWTNLREVVYEILSTSKMRSDFKLSLEISPRYLDLEGIALFSDLDRYLSFNIGVQDFCSTILSNVNRRQTTEDVIKAKEAINRHCPNAEIALDLIYGLPFQTVGTMKNWRKSFIPNFGRAN